MLIEREFKICFQNQTGFNRDSYWLRKIGFVWKTHYATPLKQHLKFLSAEEEKHKVGCPSH